MRKAQDLLVLRAAAAEIKARRASLKVSQEELAYRAGVHRSFVARLEVAQTQPSLAVLFRLSEALQVEVVELVDAIARRHRRELSQVRRTPS
jgi:transcriptional regulator with XRE-family HTH domain